MTKIADTKKLTLTEEALMRETKRFIIVIGPHCYGYAFDVKTAKKRALQNYSPSYSGPRNKARFLGFSVPPKSRVSEFDGSIIVPNGARDTIMELGEV